MDAIASKIAGGLGGVDQSRNDLATCLAILQMAVTQWEDGVTTLVLAACKTLYLT